MQIAELIAIASIRSGKKKRELGQEMGHNDETRISKMATGRLRADASEIVYLAEAANMEPILVLAEIESERHPELAAVEEMAIFGLMKREWFRLGAKPVGAPFYIDTV